MNHASTKKQIYIKREKTKNSRICTTDHTFYCLPGNTARVVWTHMESRWLIIKKSTG